MGLFHGMEVSTSAKVPHAEFFPPPPSPRGPSLWLARLDEDRRQLVRFWPVIQNMVVGELRVRYQRSILGFVWTLLNPLLMMVTLSWVFAGLNHGHQELSALLVRRHGALELSNLSLNECAFCIIQNEGLIRKIYLPKLVFPLARVLIGLVTFVLSLASLFLLLWPLGARLYPVDVVLAGGDRVIGDVFTRPRPDRGHGEHVLSRLRPPGFGVVAGVVFRDADPLSDHEV